MNQLKKLFKRKNWEANKQSASNEPQELNMESKKEEKVIESPNVMGEEAEKNMENSKENRVHNLIILDESGSMQSIYREALTGVNETLQTIRNAQKKYPNQHQFVTLVTFDSDHFNRIYHSKSAIDAKDINEDQYQPNACTPLYDAMGKSINELRPNVGKDDIVLVTIITDGYENASEEYDNAAIKSLVEEMRKKGWVFTYIGANQDVEKVAMSISINNHLAFRSDSEGTKAMFERERKSRNAFFAKSACRFEQNICPKDLEEGYFDD